MKWEKEQIIYNTKKNIFGRRIQECTKHILKKAQFKIIKFLEKD